MTTYTAYFRTDAEYATYEFKAETPEQALALAQKLYDDNPLELMFEPYDDGNMPVNEIAIYDPTGNEFTSWLDDDLQLRFAARDLLDAAEKVITRWQTGDLAEAVRDLSAAIAKAKGGAV